MKLKKIHWIGIGAGALLLLIDFIFFFSNEQMLLFLAGIAVAIIVLPFVAGVAIQSQNEQKVNELFLEFTRNLAESVATGTPVSKSIVNMKSKNYGLLNPYVQKLGNQIELGIPIATALQTFADDIGSPVIQRAVALIREAERAGGEIDYILDSTAKSISEVDKLKKERKSAVSNLVVQGYIIFFIFIAIILVMEFRILPLTTGINSLPSLGGGTNIGSLQSGGAARSGLTAEDFTRPFLYLLLTQGFFAGLIIGKLAEGSIKGGVKHSFILMITAYLVSTGARLFLGAPGGEDVAQLILPLIR